MKKPAVDARFRRSRQRKIVSQKSTVYIKEVVYMTCKNSCRWHELCGVSSDGRCTFTEYYCIECGGGVEVAIMQQTVAVKATSSRH